MEDAAQQRFIEQAGISAVQGYLHLHPVPADELTAWLLRRRAARPLTAVKA